MDLVDPCPVLQRHGFDIRTIECPDGSIQLYHSNFLGGCDDYFSWSANWNCTIDFENEVCLSSQYYDGNCPKIYAKENPWIGKKLEGVKELAETLCRAHKELLKDLPRYTAVGWDCMKTDQGYVVFEGNLSTARLDPMYFSWAQAWDYIYTFSWPFDKRRQACPSPGNDFFLPGIPENDAFLGKYVFRHAGVTSCNGTYLGNEKNTKDE
jgi:hypothetical protein